MSTMQEAARSKAARDGKNALDILSQNATGSWSLSLPANLKIYQGELEELLGKVFPSRQFLRENFPLAQQMSLNWCMSKCKEVGITFEYSTVEKTNVETALR